MLLATVTSAEPPSEVLAKLGDEVRSRPANLPGPERIAINVVLDENELQRVWMLRKALAAVSPEEAMELLLKRLRQTKNNDEFLETLSETGVR